MMCSAISGEGLPGSSNLCRCQGVWYEVWPPDHAYVIDLDN